MCVPSSSADEDPGDAVSLGNARSALIRMSYLHVRICQLAREVSSE